MPISFICPHCGRHTDVAENFAGMTGPCAGCGRPVAIPTLAEWNEQNQGQTTGRGAVGLALGGLLAVAACVFGGAILIPQMMRFQTQSQRSAAEANLKTIVGAMQQYHEKWQCFPPAITYGPDGVTPYHSWRVLLLPYLEQDALYMQYNFREPWNSPNNKFVLQQMPPVYSDGAPDGSNLTSFVVVTGDRTMFPPSTTTSLNDVSKGANQTALVVECAIAPVSWTEPRDLAYDNMNFAINDPNGQCISGAAPEGALVAKVDGTTEILNDQTTAVNYVQMMLLRDSAPFGGSSVGVATVFSPPADITRKFEPISFGELANQRLDENLHDAREGNRLEMLPGEQTLGGVNFKVEPKFMCLGGKQGTSSSFPARIDGIPVRKKCERLHFLHATGWKAPKDGTPIGHYEIHYADGTIEMAKIVYGVDVRDWWNTDNTAAVDDGRMVWTGSNPAVMQPNSAASGIRLFMSTWENPRPDVAIESIDFVSYQGTECAPFCVAMTIDNPRDAPESDQPTENTDVTETPASNDADQATPDATSDVTTEPAAEATPVEGRTTEAPSSVTEPEASEPDSDAAGATEPTAAP